MNLNLEKKYSIVKPTEKLLEVYNRIIKHIYEVVKDPENIRKYSIYESLNKREKEGLLRLYSSWKQYYNEREMMIYRTLCLGGCMTVEEIWEKTGINKESIHKKLRKLHKEGYVEHNEAEKCWRAKKCY